MPARDDLGLVARDAEIERLRRVLERASRGVAQFAVLEGEPGIGKTRLVQYARDVATGLGFRVFAGAAEELERERPFGVLADALGVGLSEADGRRARIARLLFPDPHEGGDSVDPGHLRFSLAELFLDLLEDLAAGDPVLLVAEDLHWADPSAFLVLNRARRRLAHSPLAVLGTCRFVPRPPELEALLERWSGEGGTTMRLRGLEPESVLALVRERLGAPPGPLLARQLSRAGGNPLFVLELVAALAESGEIEVSGGLADVRSPDLPPSLRLTILRRLSALGTAELDVLKAASVLGASFSLHDLAVVTGRSALDLLRLLDPPLRAAFLTGDEDQFSFRHDLVRDAVYLDIPAAARKELHAEVGRKLARAGSPAAHVAHHVAAGGTVGDVQAVEWLRAAAREIAPRAPSSGIAFLERAVELSGDAYADGEGLRLQLVEALTWGGRLEEAETLSRALLAAGPNPEIRARAEQVLFRCLLWLGRGSMEFGAVLDRMTRDPGLPDAEAARFRAEVALSAAFYWRDDVARPLAEQALAAGERLGDDAAVAMSLSAISWVLVKNGYTEAALEPARRAAEISATSTQAAARLHPSHAVLGLTLNSADLVGESLETLKAGLELAEAAGAMIHLAYYHNSIGSVLVHAGEWDDAIPECEEGLALTAEMGNVGNAEISAAYLSKLWIHRNDLQKAGEMARAAQAQPEPEIWLWPTANLRQARGEGGAAVELAAELHRFLWEEQGLFFYRLMGLDMVRVALANEATDLAASVADAVAELARRTTAPGVQGLAAQVRGLVEADVGSLVEAVDHWRRSPMPLERAEACEDAARALAARGRSREARPLAEEALATYERLRADRDIRRVEALLRSLGVRRGRRGPRDRPRSGWAALTETERRVAALVADGASNPEIARRLFISRRTVETHLSNMFSKLDISSRVELATMALQRAGQPSSA